VLQGKTNSKEINLITGYDFVSYVILNEIIKRMANWIGHILRRKCLLKQVIEGKIKGEMEMTRSVGPIM